MFYAGDLSKHVDLFVPDSSSVVGAGLTGLVYNSAGLTAVYRKGIAGTATTITLVTQTIGGAYSSGGFVEVSAASMPGLYRLDLPNASIDTEGFTTLMLYGATNMSPVLVRIPVWSPTKGTAGSYLNQKVSSAHQRYGG